MYSNFNFKLITVWTIHSNLPLCTIIHCLNNNNNPFRYTCNTHSPPYYFTWYSIKSLFKINQTKKKVFIFFKHFSWSCLTMKIVSVVPIAGIKPNCISSMTIISLIYLIIFSTTFSTFFAYITITLLTNSAWIQ